MKCEVCGEKMSFHKKSPCDPPWGTSYHYCPVCVKKPTMTPDQHRIAELEAQLTAARTAQEKSDIRADSAYLDGLKRGWNLGSLNDTALYTSEEANYLREIRAARAALKGGPDA